MGHTAEIESRHGRLIRLSKVRAETRARDSAASQLEIFSKLVGRFCVVLTDQISQADMAALRRRIERDLSKVPRHMLENLGAPIPGEA